MKIFKNLEFSEHFIFSLFFQNYMEIFGISVEAGPIHKGSRGAYLMVLFECDE